MKKLLICLVVLSALYAVCALFRVGTGVHPDRLSVDGTVVVDSLYAQKYFDGEHWLERQMVKTSRGDFALMSKKDLGLVGQNVQKGQTYYLFDTGEKFHGHRLCVLSSAFEFEEKYLRDDKDDLRAFAGVVLFCLFWFMAARWDKWF